MSRESFEKIVDFQFINNYPDLPCPYCNSKSLVIDFDSIDYRITSYQDSHTNISKKHKKHIESISSSMKENTFVGVLSLIVEGAELFLSRPAKVNCFFRCNECENHISATGTLIFYDKEEEVKHSKIKIEYFSPPLPIFTLSNNIPEEIRNEILQAFNHFHSDPTSSGAKLRRAIEKMCLDLGFKQKRLHIAISAMAKEFPHEAELLNALKLLGNEATHSDYVDENDLLNAFEVMEYVLDLYDRKKAQEVANQNALKLKEKFKKD